MNPNLTPKETADELINKFRDVVDMYSSTAYDPRNDSELQEIAVHCAIACVDGIINCLKGNFIYNAGVIDYYDEVQQEIEKL